MNPNSFKEDDIHPISNYKAFDIWNRDSTKKQIIKDNGFELISIWESDYLNDKELYTQMCLSAISALFQE